MRFRREGRGGGRSLTSEQDETIRARALKLLARREHARGELALKLAAAGGDDRAVERVLDALESQGLLSETRFTEQFVDSRLGLGHGPRRIRAELRRRGIDRAAADEAVEQDTHFWVEQASRARARRFGDAAPASYREWCRQARFLERRGFSPEQIGLVLGSAPERGPGS